MAARTVPVRVPGRLLLLHHHGYRCLTSRVMSSRSSGGELVLKQIGSNEGVAAQRIEAPVDLVWATLLDFAEWPRMVDDVVAANVYERNDADIKVEIVVGVGFLKLKTYIHHVLDQAAGTLTWTLDERKSSDLLSNTGYWMVRDGSSHGGGSVVYYSCAVQLRAWAPGWLDRYIAREGLPRARSGG